MQVQVVLMAVMHNLPYIHHLACKNAVMYADVGLSGKICIGPTSQAILVIRTQSWWDLPQDAFEIVFAIVYNDRY